MNYKYDYILYCSVIILYTFIVKLYYNLICGITRLRRKMSPATENVADGKCRGATENVADGKCRRRKMSPAELLC